MEKIREYSKQNRVFLSLSMLFVGWALAFIYNSSYVAMDERRYFNLFDDAMISMRYAWNFAHGQGLVWNAGERVEGYTNLLMTLLMSLAALVLDKRYAVLAVQLTGIFFGLGSAFLAVKIFENVRALEKNALRYLIFVVVLLYYPLQYWSLLGMETGLLAFLLGAGVLCSLKYAEKLEVKYLWWMSACFGLAYLTRNDSLLFTALAFLYLLPTLRHGRRSVLLFLAAGMLYGAFVIGQTVFRYDYYGAVMPNTYTLKLVGMPLVERLQNGWGFIQPFLKETGVILLLALAGTVVIPSRQKAYLLGLSLTSILYQVYVGGDPWSYWRIMSPTMPFLLILFVLACEGFLKLAFKPLRGSVLNALLTVAVLGGLLQANFRFLPEMSLSELPYDNEASRKHTDLALALNTVTNESATIGVFWAGTTPYYADRFVLDFLGKSDPYIANLPPDLSGKIGWNGMNSVPGHNKYDLNYSIVELRPTYVQDLVWGGQDLSSWGMEHYASVRYKGVRMYLLKDSPAVDWEKVELLP